MCVPTWLLSGIQKDSFLFRSQRHAFTLFYNMMSRRYNKLDVRMWVVCLGDVSRWQKRSSKKGPKPPLNECPHMLTSVQNTPKKTSCMTSRYVFCNLIALLQYVNCHSIPRVNSSLSCFSTTLWGVDYHHQHRLCNTQLLSLVSTLLDGWCHTHTHLSRYVNLLDNDITLVCICKSRHLLRKGTNEHRCCLRSQKEIPILNVITANFLLNSKDVVCSSSVLHKLLI